MSVDPSQRLLHWYDAHARVLPWRAPPGAPPADPYRVWLSEVMLQQTNVTAATPYFLRFTARWPNVAALAAAADGEVMAAWAGLGYYARARNLLACARMVAGPLGGSFPDTEAGLRALPGVGAYTAAAVAAIAFGRRAVVVDGNVERVTARLDAVEVPVPAARPMLRSIADRLTPNHRPGDHAQAMMDLGATICTPRAPRCDRCPLLPDCTAGQAGTAALYPRRLAKAARPQRYGTAFWVERDGQVLLRRRPARGLLGGMLALPTSPWTDAPPNLTDAPAGPTAWRFAAEPVTHVFSHFALELAVATAEGEAVAGEADEWWPIERLDAAGLPTVFARAAARARKA